MTRRDVVTQGPPVRFHLTTPPQTTYRFTMARRTEILPDGLRLVEVLVVVLAAIGVFVLATFFGAAAVLDGFKVVAP